MSAIIAEKLYVTIQYRHDANNEDGHLGFASPYTKDAAFQKRKATQDSWAYGSGCTIEIDEDDHVTFTAGSNSKVDAVSAFIGGWYPKVIKNEPIEGFEIAKSVRRYGWSGSGNVVWRITDPRGFDLEISSDNFASVISCVDMEKGVIKGKCVWGREGSKNILLPEASEPFQEALAKTKRVNQKVSLKDVQIGDTVDLLSSKLADGNTAAIFYGKMYFLSLKEGTELFNNGSYYRSYETSNGEFYFDKEVKESYLFKTVSDGKFLTIGSPKISSVINKLDKPEDKHAMALKANVELCNKTSVGDIRNVILISDTKIDLSKIETKSVPVEVSEAAWPEVETYYRHTYLAEYGGNMYITAMPSKWDKQRGEKLKLHAASFTPSENKLKLERTVIRNTSTMYYRINHQYTTVTTFDVKDVKFSSIVVKFGDIEGTVKYIRT